MKNTLITIILLMTTGCSIKWADNIADKGFDKECINDYDKAMKIYNRGILINKRSTELYWRRGCLNARNDNHDMAVKDLTKSINIDSLFNGGYAYWDRAISKEYLGDSLGALNDFDKAILINPEKENFYFFRGTLRYKLKDFEGALNDFDSALRFWNNYYLARSWRSTLRVELGDYSGAMEDFEKIEFSEKDKTNPNYAWKFRYRGIAKFETGDTIGACLDWKIAVTHLDTISIIKVNEYCK
jgi:tetratricopeptide (TPR) repeat protein